MPSAPHNLLIRTAAPVPVAKFFRAIGVEIKTGSLPDGTRCYLGQTVGLTLAVVPAAQSDPVFAGTLYFMVDDVQAAVRLVTAEGGKLVRPMLAGQRRALMADPEGRRVLLADRSGYVSKFDDLDSDHHRTDNDRTDNDRADNDRADGAEAEPPVEFTDPKVRGALQFEWAAAATIVVGSLVVAIAAVVLFYKIRAGSDRDFVLLQIKPKASPFYGWAWIAVVGTTILALGRALGAASGNTVAKVGYSILALAFDLIALALGVQTVLFTGATPASMLGAMYAMSVAGIVGSSRLQEAATRLRRPQLRFWTKTTTAVFCGMFVLPIVAAIFLRFLPRNWDVGTLVTQAVFVVALVAQIGLHLMYLLFVRTAITDPKSLD